MISCKEAVGQMWAYLDRNIGRLDEQELEQHLGLCRHCCGELEFAKQVRSLLRRPGEATEISPEARTKMEELLKRLGAAP